MLRARMLSARFAWLATITLFAACTNSPYQEESPGEKVFYSSYNEAPKTLDPAVAYTTSAQEITGKVYDTLLEYHYLLRPYTLIPSLAATVPPAEDAGDGRTRYRFDVRDDLLYQNDACFSLSGGTTRQVVAEDIAFELMRIADPAVDSPVGEPFSHVLGFAAFTERLVARRKADPAFGRLPAREQYGRAGGIAGVVVRSTTGLDIVLATPYPQILYWFAMPFTAPMPWEAVAYYDGKDGRAHLADHPVGAGAYVLEHYDKQSRIVLVKNPNWYGVRHPEWHAPAATYPTEGEPGDREAGRLRPGVVGGPLPSISRVEYRREKEQIPAWGKFLQGYYDLSGINRESFDRVVQGGRLSEEMASKGMQLSKSVIPAVYYLGFNMEDRTVGDTGGDRAKKLRQAMSLAIDAKDFTKIFYNGRGIAAQSLLPPGIAGYDERYVNPYRQVDPVRAKKLLADAGYPGGVDPKTGLPLHLTFDTADTSPDGRLHYQFFVNAWREIGVDVEIAATNYNRFQEKVRQGNYQIFMWGWVADYPDPENFMFLLWSQMARSKQGGPNTANYQNPRFDELFLQMKSRANDDVRLDCIRQMTAILEEDRPWIELYYPESYVLYQGWLENVKPVGLSISVEKYYDLSPPKRSAYRAATNRPVLWPAYALLGLLAIVIVPGVRTFFRERQ
jgi:oligopeptide transport system substrate-binding protein